MGTLPTVADPAATSPAIPAGVGQPASQPANGTLPSVTDIIAKRAAGEPLSNAEKGRLSWYGRQSQPGAKPAGPKPAAGRPPVAGLPPPAQPIDALPAPPADPAAVRVVCEAILSGIETARTHLISGAVARLDADAATVEGFAKRCAMNPGYRKVMVDTSPAAAEQLGINSQNLPIWAFLGALAMDTGQFALVYREVQTLAKTLAKDKEPAG